MIWVIVVVVMMVLMIVLFGFVLAMGDEIRRLQVKTRTLEKTLANLRRSRGTGRDER